MQQETQCSVSLYILVDDVGILPRKGKDGRHISFLCLCGRVDGKNIIITETTKGPLFVAPGSESIMFYKV